MKRGVKGLYESWDKQRGIWVPRPNIFTLLGWQGLLASAFHGDAFEWDVGLCVATPTPDLAIEDIQEPDSTGGYARQSLDKGDTNWPDIGTIENEVYVRSREFTFTATEAYSISVTRLFIIDGDDQIVSLSSAFAASTLFEDDSTHRYTLYFR